MVPVTMLARPLRSGSKKSPPGARQNLCCHGLYGGLQYQCREQNTMQSENHLKCFSNSSLLITDLTSLYIPPLISRLALSG